MASLWTDNPTKQLTLWVDRLLDYQYKISKIWNMWEYFSQQCCEAGYSGYVVLVVR